jgi:hypothetical protein
MNDSGISLVSSAVNPLYVLSITKILKYFNIILSLKGDPAEMQSHTDMRFSYPDSRSLTGRSVPEGRLMIITAGSNLFSLILSPSEYSSPALNGNCVNVHFVIK